MGNLDGDITRLLGEVRAGNRGAEARLMEAVYPKGTSAPTRPVIMIGFHL